ncbi:MAG: hypothetical protein J6H18_03425 [Lachnospiraceae bacterium]|nr:hypothetical protein [Lachnospiraceae bacterium]
MRDYKQIRGINPKKSPLLQLAQYCAVADAAEEALKKNIFPIKEGLEAFLVSLLPPEVKIREEQTVSELIYMGPLDERGNPLGEPFYEKAQDYLREARRRILREVCRQAFAQGIRSSFNRPAELAARLEEDMRPPAGAPLELLFPEELWTQPISRLERNFREEVQRVRADRERYEKEFEEARLRREEQLKQRAEAIPYEGEMGAYYSYGNGEALEALKKRYSREEIGLLQLAGRIRLAWSLQKIYRIDRMPKLDKSGYRLDFYPEWRCGESRQELKERTSAYEEAIRLDRKDALQEKKEKNQERNQRKKRNAAIRSAIVSRIPDNYIDLFPLARGMERHFVLHIGPTNSGKTHDAMEALKEAENGIYLGPLRLLAFEQYERLQTAGIPCSLVTGEERIEDPWAKHQASTIEMLNPTVEYEVAVIDEAQMIGDRDRGGAWTAAILGVCAKEIHVCAAPIAKKLLIRLIRDCGDSYTVVSHHRMTPLRVEREEFELDSTVQQGDALIVFSKKSVHGVAAYLQQRGFRCSVVYGALPYDVRREQARLFAEGQTQVVVATDAIGMGMNLPIRRVVFLEQDKFDGVEVRPLKAEEIKQIAGRAGRYGIYADGLVNAPEQKPRIREALESRSEAVSAAVIAFPESLLGVEATLTEIIERWAQIEIKPGYTRADPARMLKLCKSIQDLSQDKRFLYDCISITFDEEDAELLSLWRHMCLKEASGDQFDVERALPPEEEILARDNLADLEEAFRLCDLLYGYGEKFHHTEFREEIMLRKNLISETMTAILARQSLSGKKCAGCGRALPWNFPYRMCDACFKRKRGGGRSR